MEKDNDFAKKYDQSYARQMYEHCAVGKSAACFRGQPKLDRKTVYNWLNSEEFKVQEFIDAKENGEDYYQDFLEGLAYYKVTGMKTQQMETKGINKIDGQMLRFLLKTKFREQYSTKTEIAHSGDVSHTIIFEEVGGREEVTKPSDE